MKILRQRGHHGRAVEGVGLWNPRAGFDSRLFQASHNEGTLLDMQLKSAVSGEHHENRTQSAKISCHLVFKILRRSSLRWQLESRQAYDFNTDIVTRRPRQKNRPQMDIFPSRREANI